MTYANGGFSVEVAGQGPARDAIAIETPDAIVVLRKGRQTRVSRRDLDAEETQGEGDGVIRAPMHGKVLAVLVDEGASVVRGQRLAIIEAMKMEHTLTAPVDGTVTQIAVSAGSQVAERAKLMQIETVKS